MQNLDAEGDQNEGGGSSRKKRNLRSARNQIVFEEDLEKGNGYGEEDNEKIDYTKADV